MWIGGERERESEREDTERRLSGQDERCEIDLDEKKKLVGTGVNS